VSYISAHSLSVFWLYWPTVVASGSGLADTIDSLSALAYARRLEAVSGFLPTFFLTMSHDGLTGGGVLLACDPFSSVMYRLYASKRSMSQKKVRDLALAKARMGCLPGA